MFRKDASVQGLIIYISMAVATATTAMTPENCYVRGGCDLRSSFASIIVPRDRCMTSAVRGFWITLCALCYFCATRVVCTQPRRYCIKTGGLSRTRGGVDTAAWWCGSIWGGSMYIYLRPCILSCACASVAAPPSDCQLVVRRRYNNSI